MLSPGLRAHSKVPCSRQAPDKARGMQGKRRRGPRGWRIMTKSQSKDTATRNVSSHCQVEGRRGASRGDAPVCGPGVGVREGWAPGAALGFSNMGREVAPRLNGSEFKRWWEATAGSAEGCCGGQKLGAKSGWRDRLSKMEIGVSRYIQMEETQKKAGGTGGRRVQGH